MTGVGLLAKEVYIRLADDGASFVYTVKYGWLSRPARRVPLFDQPEETHEVGSPPAGKVDADLRKQTGKPFPGQQE
jgi:hypothetical protein